MRFGAPFELTATSGVPSGMIQSMFDPRPNRPQVIQSADCFVDAQGVMYLTDNNAGLYILQFEGA